MFVEYTRTAVKVGFWFNWTESFKECPILTNEYVLTSSPGIYGKLDDHISNTIYVRLKKDFIT